MLKCPICNSIQESKDSFQIKLFKHKEIINHRKECEVYQNFLSNIFDKIKLNKNVIDILYLTEGLKKIINISEYYKIGDNYVTVVIPEIISYIEDYEKSIYYIFANLIEINPNYNISFEYSIYENELYLSNKDVNIYFQRTSFEKKILCNIKFNIDECIPYNQLILNSEEREKLQRNILFTPKLIVEKREIYSKKKLIISEKDNINVIYQKIEQQIKDFYSEVNKIKMQLFEDNKKFFERALLELELKEF